ncbi:MAG: DUF1499 domain-containing protein [Polaromonas sp.]|nr:DUF1499 domain-containing protein [Polaromonas sp.]
MKILGFLGLFALVAALLVFTAGQMGMFSGKPPDDLGARGGRLKPPAQTPNSVSSQASLYPDHPQRFNAGVPPIAYTGDAQQAMARLTVLLEKTPGCVLVTREPGYLYTQWTTRRLKFTDDVEFLLDPVASVIHVRSASRLGSNDLGVNRLRVEALRARFALSMVPTAAKQNK